MLKLKKGVWLKMYRIGLSSCGFDLTEENFIKLQESKIEAIEISMSTDKYE